MVQIKAQSLSRRAANRLALSSAAGMKPELSSTMGTAAAKPAPVTKAALPGTFGVPGLTFPFIDNPSSIFGLMMGQDITLVRYDIGPLQATAGFSYNFPPIMVGPIPIAIGVGGSVTVNGLVISSINVDPDEGLSETDNSISHKSGKNIATAPTPSRTSASPPA